LAVLRDIDAIDDLRAVVELLEAEGRPGSLGALFRRLEQAS